VVPSLRSIFGAQWEDLRFNINSLTKPSNIIPFGITHKQMKSHPRYLWGSQEPVFQNHEGMGGFHHNHYAYHFFIIRYIMCVESS
jgi:hypothetical protein